MGPVLHSLLAELTGLEPAEMEEVAIALEPIFLKGLECGLELRAVLAHLAASAPRREGSAVAPGLLRSSVGDADHRYPPESRPDGTGHTPRPVR